MSSLKPRPLPIVKDYAARVKAKPFAIHDRGSVVPLYYIVSPCGHAVGAIHNNGSQAVGAAAIAGRAYRLGILAERRRQRRLAAAIRLGEGR